MSRVFAVLLCAVALAFAGWLDGAAVLIDYVAPRIQAGLVGDLALVWFVALALGIVAGLVAGVAIARPQRDALEARRAYWSAELADLTLARERLSVDVRRVDAALTERLERRADVRVTDESVSQWLARTRTRHPCDGYHDCTATVPTSGAECPRCRVRGAAWDADGAMEWRNQ